jgi:hypothetical protein
MKVSVRQRKPIAAPSDTERRERKRQKDRQRRANELAASRALRAAFGGKGSRRGQLAAPDEAKPRPLTLEEMLAHNPTALALLEGAKALRAQREVEEAKRTLDLIESWDRLHDARLKKCSPLHLLRRS